MSGMSIFVAGLILISGAPLAAAEDSAGAAEEAAIEKSARDRAYPGGKDEEDLEVQNQITAPKRKLGDPAISGETPSSEDEF